MAMFENLGHFFKRMVKTEQQKELGSKDAAKERLHLVLMQDRANVSADFLELMKQEIIDVIKKYIVVDEESIDVRLTNQANDDGTNGAPSLYANIPIVNIKNDMMAQKVKEFEGVDFNKEMGIPSYIEEIVEEVSQTEKEELKTPDVIELPENMEEVSSVNEEIEGNEPKEMFEEIDDVDLDDDDDVTFDDLLKAAEEAEKKKQEEKKKKEADASNNDSNSNNNSSSNSSSSGTSSRSSLSQSSWSITAQIYVESEEQMVTFNAPQVIYDAANNGKEWGWCEAVDGSGLCVWGCGVGTVWYCDRC